MLIILNQKFDTLTQMQLTQEATQAEKVAYGKLFQEVHQLAKDVEKSIKEI